MTEARAFGTGTFIMPEVQKVEDTVNVVEKIVGLARVPLAGLPAHSGDVRGRCSAFDPENGHVLRAAFPDQAGRARV